MDYKVQLHYLTDTDNKSRWVTLDSDPQCDAPFHVYIPKWRVPSPPPEWVVITISQTIPDARLVATTTSDDILSETSASRRPIESIVKKTTSHNRVVRYDPISEIAEIGSPYIPRNLTFSESEQLFLRVDWS